MKKTFVLLAAVSAAVCSGVYASGTRDSGKKYSIRFNPDVYEERSVTSENTTVKYRAYEKIVYVRNPVDTTYEIMNIYIPSAYFENGTVNGYTAGTAPVFLPNMVGGYMPGLPGTPDDGTGGPGPGPAFDGGRPGMNAIAYALVNGFVVASPGARGRTTAAGRAPACIVDLKAAVRYLRYNDKIMPGDAGKIISNGTSAGGALSALLGAGGDNSDYEPYLKQIGAADERDGIYAVSAYCPITDLDHADAAYEWLFNGYNTYEKIDISMLDYKVQRKLVAGSLTDGQMNVSAELKKQFPSYVNSLGLVSEDGTELRLADDGSGTFRERVKKFVMESAQKALDGGADMSPYAFLTISSGKVTDIDFAAYVGYAGRQKLPPAFDALDLSSGENNLFGTAAVESQHFTSYSEKNSLIPDAGTADPRIVKMMNPLNYIGTAGTTTAQYWRIRQGTKDRDTSLAVPVILATTLENRGYDVDFALPWDKPHGGDYDLDELFAWINSICR